MTPFSFVRADSLSHAIQEGRNPNTRFIAGGTNLVDLMKQNVDRPSRLIDISALDLGAIAERDGGGISLGAMASNADTAYHPLIKERYPLLASAILAGASPQLRNAATNGGNLNQRTRCYYFYDTATPCNKREPGSGCSAIGGVNRIHAILGASNDCIATHPSDMCVALSALDAVVHVTGPDGDRSIPLIDYHRLPGNEPWRDNVLEDGELVTSIDLPAETFPTNYSYLKLRDRLSYAFALVSVAVALQVDASTIQHARVALGGVAHKPWRDLDIEHSLIGKPADDATYRAFADSLLSQAVGQGANDFKIDLARAAIVRALRQAAAGTPQSQSNKRII
ncbi:MAG: xanthine dehydrogenase family protein subunit M [Hyphomicrobiaceae bacterium]|nr:xanthine dehydrogenase family protein subunit M [Hyphomicrobiaceae bacterium]